MLRIHCPFCGERDHAEFTYGRDGSIAYPPLDAGLTAWHDAVFMRDNPRGVQWETWQHSHGCRMWLLVQRDTLTHEIHAVRPCDEKIAAALQAERDAQVEGD